VTSLFAVRIVRPHKRNGPPENPFHAGHWIGPPEEGSRLGFEIVPYLARVGCPGLSATLTTSRQEAEELLRSVLRFDADFEIVEFKETK
jgi:hypothetical protein